MKTYYLGREEVRGYLRDFLRRLSEFEHVPTVWCPITKSGLELLQEIVEIIKTEKLLDATQIEILPINVDDEPKFSRPEAAQVIANQSVLLLDGAIHSGKMMRDCAELVQRHGPAELSAYSLVIKRGSMFIPTLWGVMIDETDRAYFLLNDLPNQRLDVGNRKQTAVTMHLLNKQHTKRGPLLSGVASIDRVTWSDRLFQMQSTECESCTYLLERQAKIAGFVTLQRKEPKTLYVAEVATDPEFQGQGYGGVLMRFANTMARQNNCYSIQLNAISNNVKFYENFEYQLVAGKAPLQLDNEEYHLMEHPILYHDGPWR